MLMKQLLIQARTIYLGGLASKGFISVVTLGMSTAKFSKHREERTHRGGRRAAVSGFRWLVEPNSVRWAVSANIPTIMGYLFEDFIRFAEQLTLMSWLWRMFLNRLIMEA